LLPHSAGGRAFGFDDLGVYCEKQGRKLYLSSAENKEAFVQEATTYQLRAKYGTSIKWLIDGMGEVLPVELFAMFTVSEINNLFCGRPDIDISLLKKVTEYDKVRPDDEHIKFFWEVLEEMQEEEKVAFVEFVSARSRLPNSADEFPMNFKIQAANLRQGADPDTHLPYSQTCFFTIALPKYSSKEICRRKLLLAIFNSPTMDADFVQRNASGY
jgi:hypothetical protein